MTSKRYSEFHVAEFDDSQLKHIGGLKRRGLMLALSSPSGAGKTTLTRRLLELDPDVMLSVSATTRAPREGEEHGKHYYFHSVAEFQKMVAERELLEHTKYQGNYYGTPRAPVMHALEDGRDVVFDMDTNGVEQVAAFARDDLVSVFILPPSLEEMEQRLRTRATDTDEVILRRLQNAGIEIANYNKYDYVLINRHLDDSMYKLRTILGAERMKRTRLRGFDDFVKKLTKT